MKFNKENFFRLTFVILWMLCVFVFSSQDANTSLKQSSNVIKIIEQITSEDESQEDKQETNIKDVESNKQENKVNEIKENKVKQFIVRKLAHFTLYAVGGFLIFNFLYSFKNKISINKIRIYTVLAGFIYSISDETHQLFINGRTGRPLDICIDTSGVIVGMFSCQLLYSIYNLSKKKIKKETKQN